MVKRYNPSPPANSKRANKPRRVRQSSQSTEQLEFNLSENKIMALFRKNGNVKNNNDIHIHNGDHHISGSRHKSNGHRK